MSDAPLQLIALALFAELNARIDAGEPRQAVLTEKGLSEEEFRREQQRWLQLLASQADQQQWQLQQRYSAAYSQWRLRNRPHDPPPLPSRVDTMPGIVSPLRESELSLGPSPRFAAPEPTFTERAYDAKPAEPAPFAYPQPKEPLPFAPQPYAEERAVPQPYVAERYTPEPQAEERYVPRPYAEEHAAPRPYAEEHAVPRPYAAERYAPEPYASEPLAPEPYAPKPSADEPRVPPPYTPSAEPPVAGAAAVVSPQGASASPNVARAPHPNPPIDLNATAFPGTVVLPAIAFPGAAAPESPHSVAKPAVPVYSESTPRPSPAPTDGRGGYAAQPEPQYPAPQYPAPQYPAPQYPAPQYPAPQYPAPQYPTPERTAPPYAQSQYSQSQYSQSPQPEREWRPPAEPVFVSSRSAAAETATPQQPLFVSPKPAQAPYSPQPAHQPSPDHRMGSQPAGNEPASASGPPYFSSPHATRAESFSPNSAPAFAASGYFVTGVSPQAQASPAASPTALSALPLSFEQLTCLSVEIDANPSQAATALAGYGIDRAGYDAQLQALRVRCEADPELAQRHARLVQYYRAVVTKR